MTRILGCRLPILIVTLAALALALSGTPAAAAEPCANGVAVNDPERNPLLVQDCNALLEARNTLSGGGRRLIWTADMPMSKWEGISIEGSPARVTELRIYGGLEGTIPLELGQLTGLVTLDLSSNALKGTIPPELGRLTQLVTLRLDYNELTGEIPATLGRLANLYDLDLYNNELTGDIPAEVGQLKGLTRLRLSRNKLTGPIPPELGGLHSLGDLKLEHNELSGTIPPELGGLTKLEAMILSYNRLTGEIPAELRRLDNLEWIQLNNNELTGGVPAWLGELTNLEVLGLRGNTLTGTIPGELSNLIDLRSLNLGENKLTGHIPSELGQLIDLESLYLDENRLSGPIPETLGQLTWLSTLSLAHNELTGEIPEPFGNLGDLSGLSLRANRLSGGIPASLGQLHNLRSLSLDQNELTGEIPRELGNLTELWTLYLSQNHLSGEIPAELGDLPELYRIGLEHNSLSGEIPPALSKLTRLQILALGWNQLTGEIPASFGELENMEVFRVNDNGLTGCVPLALSRFDSWDFARTNLRFCFAVDDGPAVVASPTLLTAAEGRTIRIDESVLLANDMETENYTLRITDVSDAVNGSVFLDGSMVVYWHNGSETTTGGFSYTGSDGVHSSVATVTVAVTPVNDPPQAVNDRAEVDEGGTAVMAPSSLLANDRDAEDDEFWFLGVGDAVNGTVALEGSEIVYEHDGSETRAGSFSYTVGDGQNTAAGRVTLRVNPVNDPPEAVNDRAEVDEGGMVSINESALLANDTDAENDELRILSVGEADIGKVHREGSAVVYRHDGSETIEDSFDYTVSDGQHTASATVILTITPVNDPPEAVNDRAEVDEGGMVAIETSVLLSNDKDVEDDELQVVAVGEAENGTVSLDGSAALYEHDGTETRGGGFSYTVSDGQDTAVGTVTLRVNPVNDPPEAVNDRAEVDEGGMVAIEASVLLSNDKDVEEDEFWVLGVGDAVNGTVALEGSEIVYEHDGSETRTGSFSYRVSDGQDTAVGTVTLSVNPVNDPPEAVNDRAEADEGGTVVFEASGLLTNDSDAEDDELKVIGVRDAVNGTASLEGTRIVYEHDGSETTGGSFRYTVSDGQDTASGMVALTINPVNDPPEAVGDTAEVDEGGMVILDASGLLANDRDADDELRVTAVGNAVNGTVLLEGTRVIYEHDGSETTGGSFEYTLSDGQDTASAAVILTVNPVNDPPEAMGDAVDVDEGGTVVLEAPGLLANDRDAENDKLQVVAVSGAVNGRVSLEGVRIVYEHDGSDTKSGSFDYTVSDGHDTDSATVAVTVTPSRDFPVVLVVSIALAVGLVIALALVAVRARTVLRRG